MSHAKPRLGSAVLIPLRCVLAFGVEVARNTVAEVRWRRAQARLEQQEQGAQPAS